MTCLAEWKTEASGWPNQEASRLVDTRDCRWHVQRAGRGPRFLLLHGTGASTHSWAGLFRHLVNSSEVLAPDLPGHAFTECRKGTDFSLSGMALALQRLLEEERFQPDVLIGHSAGAAIAVRLAGLLSYRPSLLVSLNGALRPLKGAAGVFGPAFAGVLGANPLVVHALTRAALDRRRVAGLIRSTGSEPCQPYLGLYARLFATPRHVRGTLRMMASWDLSRVMSELKALDIPLLQITGERDRAVNPDFADQVAAACPGARHVRLSGLGHLAHEEDPERISRVIKSEISISRISRSRGYA